MASCGSLAIGGAAHLQVAAQVADEDNLVHFPFLAVGLKS